MSSSWHTESAVGVEEKAIEITSIKVKHYFRKSAIKATLEHITHGMRWKALLTMFLEQAC